MAGANDGSKPNLIGENTFVRLGFVVSLVLAGVYVGHLTSKVEDGEKFKTEAKETIAQFKAESKESIDRVDKNTRDAIAAISSRIERIDDAMMEASDVKLAVHEAMAPELARLWEKLGAIEEWQRNQERNPQAAAK